jgi:hypothetical protein
MKIIFSRKGFDSSAGGCPSPIVEGRPISLPIPTKMPTATCFSDLAGPYADLVRDLTKGRLSGDDKCHVDPDLIEGLLPRQAGWRGSLGQVSSSQTHLSNQGVGVGDLFLFWGLFRPVERRDRWSFIGEPRHLIWGWLQVGAVIDLGSDGSHALKESPWLDTHPHARSGWGSVNVLYTAGDQLKLESQQLRFPAFGVLAKGFRLTADGASPSIWRVPDWLNPSRGGVGMTYHSGGAWNENGTAETAGRGQEFVAQTDGRADAGEWVESLLTNQEGST